jgi:Tfp pilus assembly protein PilF
MDDIDRALELFQQAYEHQMRGDLDEAVELYKASIATHPTAEAHTFLGWTYSSQGRLDEAIAECRQAIEVDPDFGNPYNDIGAYLIEQGKPDQAIPWLERALTARRYSSYHFPWFNLGRARAAREELNAAIQCFERALEIDPDYELARDALDGVKRRIH